MCPCFSFQCRMASSYTASSITVSFLDKTSTFKTGRFFKRLERNNTVYNRFFFLVQKEKINKIATTTLISDNERTLSCKKLTKNGVDARALKNNTLNGG